MKHSMKTFPFTVLCLFMFACKPTPPSPIVCENATPFTADFQILENVGDSLIETDKVLMFNRVQFSSKKRYRTYQWQIGTDPRSFNDPEVSLVFHEDAIGLIPITLIATTAENNPCFPDEPKIDTLTKFFQVIEWKDAPIIGKYEGTFSSNSNDIQIVEVRYISKEENVRYEPYGGFQLINVNKGCNLEANPTVWSSSDRGSSAMYFDAYGTYHDGCLGPLAWLRLVGNDTLQVEFSTGTLSSSSQRNYDTFTGIRLK